MLSISINFEVNTGVLFAFDFKVDTKKNSTLLQVEKKTGEFFFIDGLSDNTIYTFYVQALIYHIDVEFEKVPMCLQDFIRLIRLSE